ncbi:MAG: hypothetical protein FJY80_10665 [Candidatus Aminicenantes bacterium]|nr:hypothetical protein [Candidatus Aminicenantes bacterium]
MAVLNRCRRRLVVVFGGLFLAALAYLPVKSSTVTLGRDPQTNAVWRKTSTSLGFMFAPAFLRLKNDPLPDEQSYAVRYALRRSLNVRTTRVRLNGGWWLLEVGFLAALGAFDYFFLCRRRPKSDSARPGAPGNAA